ncbi:MAG: hypothetical protein LAT67_00360 [Balneolales bacterium]|nr:hypothetical protein [Balneolales bacterium]
METDDTEQNEEMENSVDAAQIAEDVARLLQAPEFSFTEDTAKGKLYIQIKQLSKYLTKTNSEEISNYLDSVESEYEEIILI